MSDRGWTPEQAAAWGALADTHRAATRAVEADLAARHGLSVSSLDLLGRLADAPGHELRLSALAAGCGLSLSRVSRLAAALEARGILTRRRAAGDSRGVEARLTAAGAELVAAARVTQARAVRVALLDRLTPTQTRTLTAILSAVGG